jgi:methionyl aminopeptidase
MFRSRDRIEIKSADQIQVMRAAGLVVARTLQRVSAIAAAGVTTADLDECAAQSIRDEGATPSFLGYHGFPAHICVSVNDEVVHGIPGSRRLADGDVVSIDCGAIVDGWHGDAALTVLVGDVAEDLRELSRVT